MSMLHAWLEQARRGLRLGNSVQVVLAGGKCAARAWTNPHPLWPGFLLLAWQGSDRERSRTRGHSTAVLCPAAPARAHARTRGTRRALPHTCTPRSLSPPSEGEGEWCDSRWRGVAWRPLLRGARTAQPTTPVWGGGIQPIARMHACRALVPCGLWRPGCRAQGWRRLTPRSRPASSEQLSTLPAPHVPCIGGFVTGRINLPLLRAWKPISGA